MNLLSENGACLVGFTFTVKENGPSSNHFRVHGFFFGRFSDDFVSISLRVTPSCHKKLSLLIYFDQNKYK